MPPKESSKLKGLLDFPFLSGFLNLPIFALERRVFSRKPGSNPVLLSYTARLHLPSGFRNHLISVEAFLVPLPAQKIFWICSRDGHKYWRRTEIQVAEPFPDLL